MYRVRSCSIRIQLLCTAVVVPTPKIVCKRHTVFERNQLSSWSPEHVQAAVQDCLGQAIAQYCRFVGRDSSDTEDSDREDSDSASEGCTSSVRSETDPELPACASEHSAGNSLDIHRTAEYRTRCITGGRSGCMSLQPDLHCMLGN